LLPPELLATAKFPPALLLSFYTRAAERVGRGVCTLSILPVAKSYKYFGMDILQNIMNYLKI